jgi:hypothetical protein
LASSERSIRRFRIRRGPLLRLRGSDWGRRRRRHVRRSATPARRHRRQDGQCWSRQLLGGHEQPDGPPVDDYLELGSGAAVRRLCTCRRVQTADRRPGPAVDVCPTRRPRGAQGQARRLRPQLHAVGPAPRLLGGPVDDPYLPELHQTRIPAKAAADSDSVPVRAKRPTLRESWPDRVPVQGPGASPFSQGVGPFTMRHQPGNGLLRNAAPPAR